MDRQKRPDNVALRADDAAVVILDQTLLPGREVYLDLATAEQMWEAIQQLRVRGAPAIGVCAAYCYFVLANALQTEDIAEFLARCRKAGDYLVSSRPTAVNLAWATKRMEGVVTANSHLPVPDVKRLLKQEAIAIQHEDIAMCTAISEHGLRLLKDGDGVLTHCNAGPLATSLYGTGQGPLLLAAERGVNIRVYADETRPLLQGARLTTYELQKAGADVTLICDNMAATVMKNGWVNFCFVGADRIAANGDAANKIGTLGVAVLAKHYGIPFYVLAPTSTIDLACQTGDDIVIEQREPDEIRTKWYEAPMAPEGVQCYNPAFDVSSHELIAGIITEHGIARPPYTESLTALFAK